MQIHPSNGQFLPITEDYKVSFYPEGETLLGGTACRVTFQTENRRKQPVKISGHIQSTYGDTCTILSGSHGGIGSFSFVPKTGVNYFLVCRSADSLQKVCPLPKVQASGETLTAGWQKESLVISRKTGGDTDRKAVRYLSVCSEYDLLYWDKWDSKKDNVFIKQEQLPDGPLQLALYDESLHLLSKRSVFSGNDKRLAHTAIQIDQRTLTGSLKQLSARIKVTDQAGKPLECDLSISVITRPDSSEYKPDGSLWRSCNLPVNGLNYKPSLSTYMKYDGTLLAPALDDLMLTLESDREDDPTQSQAMNIDKQVYLDPVIVKASALPKKKHDTSYAAFADLHFDRQTIEQRKLTDVLQIFRGYPSIRILPDRTIRIRGAKTTPLVVIDDIPLSYTVIVERWLESPPLDQLSIEDIERVDIIQGGRAAIFGMYGANGVVCITTRTGKSGQEDKTAQTINEPSFRTLFWQPDLQTNAQGEAKLSFPALIRPTDIIHVQIEGISSDGPVVFGLWTSDSAGF